MLPTPSEIITHLDKYVRGQDRAKQDLAVAVYNHYLSQAYRETKGADLGRHHILLIGPTGVGKTYLIKTLADFLGVPVGFTSATGLVEMGYKGNSVESMVAGLLTRAGGNPQQAEKGIIFIDEIDKIRRSETGGRDVSGEGVQNALLTLMDGRSVSGLEHARHAPVDTSRLLFIATGAFAELPEIIDERIGTDCAIGFRPRPKEADCAENLQPQYSKLCQMETGDLVDYGMIPELIGRFATLTPLHELGRKDLAAILTDGLRRSPWQLQQELAAIHGIQLEAEPEAFEELAKQAEILATGARGLHRLIGRALDAVDFQWAEIAAQGHTQVTLTAAAVRGEADPTYGQSELPIERTDHDLREKSLQGLPDRPNMAGADSAGTRLADLSSEAIWERIETTKSEKLDWSETRASAREWWETFEQENRQRPVLVYRIVEELQDRKASITDLFMAFARSGTDNIQANLHYMDYFRIKGTD